MNSTCTILSQELESRPHCRVYCFRSIMDVKYDNYLINETISTMAYNNYKGLYLRSILVKEFVDQHPVGSRSICFFDPENAENVTFGFKTNSSVVYIQVIGGIFMVLGIILIIVFLVIFMKRERFAKY